MAGTKNADLIDLIATTLPNLPEQYFEVTWTNNDYEACRIYQRERMEIDGGTSIKRKVMFSPTGNARYRRLFDTDDPAVSDVMVEIDVPWTQIGTHYSWDILEIKRNANSARGFIRLLETRRIDGLWSLADLIEERFWKTPDSSTDDLNPYGVPYYLNMLDVGGTTAGFNGKNVVFGDRSLSVTCAGISTTTEPRWANWAAVYTKVDNALLEAFRLAFTRTKFKAPLIINDPSQARNAAKRVYCNSDTIVKLQVLADARDDFHRGKDVLGNIRIDDGATVYLNRLPVVYITQLDDAQVAPTGAASATMEVDPIYCVDFEKFIPYVQDGYWMEEGEPMTDRLQHTTFTIFLDGSHNNLCVNRRQAGFVLHKPIVA
ncbi:hypothetical protein LCGC14_0437710 [marine sediment metagenome]|uniref:Bacteriophage Mu GpT domain-containing protein n=1 Tax=marine sediment metagenome TaxID=412755 RepID=A0A0F9SLG0_9ZZZZ